MSHICDSRRTKEALQRSAGGQKWVTLHFFFDFRAEHSAANSIEGMLRSLLYQLVKRVPDAARHIDHTLYTGSSQHDGLRGCMDNLCDALGPSATRICAFIDGLDEFEGSSSELLEVIHKLEDRTNLKICLASRPYTVFTDSLSRYPHLAMQDHNDQSIRSYAEAQWANSRLGLKATLPPQLSDEVREKAKGVFLWARLATDELFRGFLAGRSVEELRQQLREIPAEVKEMYQRILDRLPQILQSEAAILLYMIIASKARITVHKLYAALDAIVRKLGGTIQILALPTDGDNDSRVTALLGDFLDFRLTAKSDSREHHTPETIVENVLPVWKHTLRNYVTLTHETLRSFLLESTWLRRHLPQVLTIDTISSCWRVLYLKELAGCMLECNDDAVALHRQSQIYLEKMEEHLNCGNVIVWDSCEEALMRLLVLWTSWTPLLPYALIEIFNGIRACDLPDSHFALLQQILISPFHPLHSAICLFKYHNTFPGRRPPPWAREAGIYSTSCGTGFKRHIEMLGKDLSLAIYHQVPGYVRYRLSEGLSMDPGALQYLFDSIWRRSLWCKADADLVAHEYLPLLGSLIAGGCRMNGTHLCSLFGGNGIVPILKVSQTSFLRQHLVQQKLEHSHDCKYTLKHSEACGFLSHWAECKMKTVDAGSLDSLLQVLLACGQDINQVCEVQKEPVLNVILKSCLLLVDTPSCHHRIWKLIAALKAGANPYTEGDSGNAFDVANTVLQILSENQFDKDWTRVRVRGNGEELRKMIELMQYCVASENTLPPNLDEYLRYETWW